MQLIESLKRLICCEGNTPDTFREKCYSDVVELACKVGIESTNHEHLICNGTVIMSHQNQFVIISKKY